MRGPILRGLLQPAQLAAGGGWTADLAALAHLPGPQALARLGYLVKRPLLALRFGSPLLARAAVAQPLVTAPDPWPGDAERGSALIDGAFLLAGREILDPSPLWAPPTADQEWLAELHAFSWLRDLRSVGGDKARRRARELLGSWLARHERWRAPAWDPEVTGRRLAEWFGHYEFVAASAEAAFRELLLQSTERQGRYLLRVLPAGLAGGSLVAATKGLIYAAVCLPAGRPWLPRALELLARELPRQILGDGGQVERSPARQAALLRDLIDIRATLSAGGLETPAEIAAAIATLGPVLRLLRHGDGGLALFNGAGEGEDWQLDLLLQRAGARGQPLMSAPETGFQRLQAGRSVVLVDCGPPPPRGFDAQAHAGTLSFEMSVGRDRMIVNCGARYDDVAWRPLQRSTAAHSTLTVEDTNSSDVTAGGLGKRRAETTARREESDGATWLSMTHDGYLELFGLLHRRRLFLSAAGDDLRGEDRLTPERCAVEPCRFALRFHLHPNVRASLIENGTAVLLRLPKGDGWRFVARGAALGLEDSLYLGAPGAARRCNQIVLTGESDPGGAEVKWALRRIGGRGDARAR